MAVFYVACSQITWSSEARRQGTDPAQVRERALAEIAEAGYEGAPAGLRSGESPQEVIDRYASYGLRPAPGYLSGDFHDPAARDGILQQARAHAEFTAGIGCTELYVAAGGFQAVTATGRTRRQAAAHVRPSEMLTDDQFHQFADTLNEVGRITLAQGVRSCFHNHVGSLIETREEIDRLFDLVDRDVVFQGPDIGHLAWAGADPVQFCDDYAESIKSVHLKDIDPGVLARGLEEGWDYGQFSDAGIFAELGEGMVDFPAIFAILGDVGYEGWIVVETDRTIKPTAMESAVISRNYLESIGI